MKTTKKKLWALLLTVIMIMSMMVPALAVGAEPLDAQDTDTVIMENDAQDNAADEEGILNEQGEDAISDEADTQDENVVVEDENAVDDQVVVEGEEKTSVHSSEDYVYGTVNMNYADFYYGELEGIEASDDTDIPAATQDPVTTAGYRETGYYDAATFATPKGFIYDKKWETWPGTYSQPIIDEYGITIGGQILGVENVNVAVLKTVYEAAKANPGSVVGQKVAEITLNADQSAVPISYKVLNSDGVYSKFINPTDPVETTLDGSLHTEYMGDDIWWEGKAMKHDAATQTIIGGLIEWTENPSDPNSEKHVIGLKHDENMYSDTWIGWGMGPGNVGIYGGNETGWQRFAGISGNYLTKMSYILLNEDGSVTYYNATSAEGLINPYLPNGLTDENGKYYGVGISNYEFTKDRVIIDFTLDVPTREDGTPEADYYLNSCSAPGISLSCSGANATYITKPEVMPVYEESEWVNGHKTIHMEVSRDYMGTGRFKYWFYINSESKRDTDRAFGTIAAWKMLYPELTSENVYLKDGKLCVDSDLFTVKDYLENPYQQIEIIGDKGTELIWATGDAYSNNKLFAGATKEDGTVVNGLIKEDGTIDLNAEYYYTTRMRDENGNRITVEHVDPVFPNGANENYEVVMYSGGFPIVKGALDSRATQKITVSKTSYSKKYGAAAFSLGAKAKTALEYKSNKTSVATVNSAGKVTIKGVGTATITITAKANESYKQATKTVKITVAKAGPTIKVKKTSASFTAAKVKAKAQSFSIGAAANSKGKLTCTKKSGSSKVTISKAGKVTVKKGTAKGTYKIKVNVKAAAKGNYKAGSKAVTITVKVK